MLHHAFDQVVLTFLPISKGKLFVDSESVFDSRADTTFLSDLAHAFFHFINIM